MKLTTVFGLAAAFVGIACTAAPVSADEFTPAQKTELGAFIKDYLVNNPDVLRQAIEALDKHDKETADTERQKVVDTQSSALFSSKYQATLGNPKGSATLVEFFDYNCHYCKGALPDVTKLMKERPEPQAGSQGLSGPGAGVGRGGEGRQRGAQSIAGRQVLGFPLEAACDPRTRRQD